jgi:prepilin-type N-terminal cleavage/methylation domain-containing protein
MSRRRAGFTLLELVVVMAILLILGSLAIPTMVGVRGNTGIKAGVDAVRAKMFDARSKAMDEGVAYRLSVSDDGKKLQVAPDDPNSVDPTHHGMTSTEDMPDGVVVKVQAQDGVQAAPDQTGWVRVATFMADGTCREDFIEVVVTDTTVTNAAPMRIQIRGVTGAIRTVKPGGNK